MKRILLLAVVALVVYQVFPEDDRAKPDHPPEAYVYDSYYGATYKRPAVATEDRAQSHWAQDLVEGYDIPRIKHAPMGLSASDLSRSCGLPRPSSDAEVVFVEIYSGYDETPLHFVSHKSLAAIGRHIHSEQAHSKPAPEPDIDTAHQVDVFVTELERPVYLVLAAYDATIWSLQMAEGVKLDGVAVLGYEPQALAHLPERTRVAFAVHDQSPQSHCTVVPKRPVNDTWTAVEIAMTDPKRRGFQREIDTAIEQHRRYRDWLRARVGRPDRTIDASRTAHVLVGPKPATPLDYRTLAGTQLLFTPTAVPVWADIEDLPDIVYEMARSGS